MSDPHETLRETNARLQARIDELETKPDDGGEPIVTTETANTAKALPERAVHEFTRFSRALLVASVEHLKVSAEAIDVFAKEASNFSTNTTESMPVMFASIPRSFTTGVVKALDRALDAPSRAVEQFYKSYTAPQPPPAVVAPVVHTPVVHAKVTI
jgi:hypothetical protein